MFIARIPNRKSPPAILLRESYRENGKVKTRTLANLSKLPASAIDVLKRSLMRILAEAEHPFLPNVNTHSC